MRRTAIFAVMLAIAIGRSVAAQQQPIPALDPADVDTTCKPCENFYRFATGGWEKRTEIPAAYSSWSSFNELTERNFETVRAILDSAAADARAGRGPRNSDRRRLGVYYASCMDSATVEARGARPIRPYLDRIDRIRTRAQLRAEIARLARDGFVFAFGYGATQDPTNSKRVILETNQAGLGLPDRDYYYRADSATTAIRDAYRDHVAAMLRLTGAPAAASSSQADAVLALETSLAEGSFTRLQLRDPKATYHFMSLEAADSLMPSFSWGGFLATVGAPVVDSLNVAQPGFFRTLGRELENRPLDDWKAYLRFHVAASAAPLLSSAFVRQNFAMSSRIDGARELLPRWRRCLSSADRMLTDALGREYVKTAYTPAAKATMDTLIDNLLAAYRARIEKLPWMGEATRAEALKKLASFGRKIGYPERWRDYQGLEVEPGLWFENARHAISFAWQREFAKIGKPVDRGEWLMTPPTVNAYYSAANNEIVFPAGRLQPPFFHPSYDLAANYGGIAATIGHEMSHGFDDQGRKYDAEGNLRDWWTDEDAERFTRLAGQIERQYSAYTVLDSLHLNGRQTLGENIADVAGVSIAYEALERALAGKPRRTIDGFTPEQRFFLAWAQARRQIWRDAALRLTVQVGVHSPGEFRVNGPLSNMPEFAKAFGCTRGDPMVRDEPSRIW
jgi:putative endopeptidase